MTDVLDQARLSVATGKYWLTKRNPNFIYECMECLGGAGYIEESPLPRLFRESPLNAIWEGSGNVIALDMLRTLAREPMAMDALIEEISSAHGASPILDRAGEDLINAASGRAPSEMEARRTAERMSLVLQAALLARNAPSAVADGFIASRLAGEGGATYGILPAGVDVDALVNRQRVD